MNRLGARQLWGGLLVSLLFLASCAAAPPPPSPASLSPAETARARENERRLAELVAARSAGMGESGNYRIGVGDHLQVSVFGVGALEGRYLVARDGTILLPLVDEVRAEGLTEDGLAKVISNRLEEQYLQSPVVNVSVTRFWGRRVTVLGAVVKPGFYPIADPGATIQDVINRAGGLRRATATWLYLSPASAVTDGWESAIAASWESAVANPAAEDPIEIDLSDLNRGRLVPAFELPVRNGDVLYIEEAGEVVVDGWVRRPRPIRLRPGLSLVQAITDAGGLHFGASPRSVEISRRGRAGPGETLTFNYDDLAAGSNSDVRLRAGDRVHVGGNPIKVSMWAVYSVVDALVNVAFGGRIALF